MGNPTLAPEQSLELNVGTSARFRNGSIEGNFFHRSIDDYITVTPDRSLSRRLPLSPTTVFRYINGTSARFTGYELAGTAVLGPFIDAIGSVSYVWAEDELFDEPVFGIAPLEQRYRLHGHTDDRRIWVALDVTKAADQNRVATSRLEVPTVGWTLVDIRAGIALVEGLSLRLGIENLANEQFATHLNALNPFNRQRVAEPGRSVYVGVEYEY